MRRQKSKANLTEASRRDLARFDQSITEPHFGDETSRVGGVLGIGGLAAEASQVAKVGDADGPSPSGPSAAPALETRASEDWATLQAVANGGDVPVPIDVDEELCRWASVHCAASVTISPKHEQPRA